MLSTHTISRVFLPVVSAALYFVLTAVTICHASTVSGGEPDLSGTGVTTATTTIAEAPSSERTSAYQVGPGDQLEIAVWKDEALTKTVVVLPDGKITFPLIGDVVAGGKTIADLKQELSRLLSRFVPDLVLSVEVKQSNSMLVYVIGRVNQPGRLVLNTRINVLQALAMAGGFTPYASKDRVKVFRQENGATRMHQFRYTDVVEGKRLDENIELRRGDVIVVP